MASLEERARIKADFEMLQREYRNMETMRKAYSEESLAIIKKQREIIEKLQKENESMKTELDLEARVSQRRALGDSTLSQLNDQIDMYTEKVEVERRNAEQLATQVEVMKQKIADKRRNIGGVNAAKENQAMVGKQVRILENRLDKALIKFNEALAKNKEQRDVIDNLRRERVVFDNIYRKLEKDLHEKKKQMANIIELSNQAYEARDGAQMEIAAIQQALSRERAEHEQALGVLEQRLQEQLARAAEVEHAEHRGDLTAEEEEELKNAVSKAQSSAAKDKAAVQLSLEKVHMYEDAFNKIRGATGIYNIDELVAAFIANEDQNFSLFNFVSEQNAEIERLEEQLALVRDEEAKHGTDVVDGGDGGEDHRSLVKELETKLTGTDAAAEKYDARFVEAQKTVNSLKIGIQSIFRKIECNERLMAEMLADSQVTENNMMQLLGMIEQRTNEILQTYSRIMTAESAVAAPASEPMTESKSLVSLLGMGPSTRHGLDGSLQVDPPKLDEFSSEEDESDDEAETRPLTMKELKDKTLKSISTRAVAPTKGRGRGRGRS